VRLHLIRNGQLYRDYRGDPLAPLLLKRDGSSEKSDHRLSIPQRASMCSSSFPAAPPDGACDMSVRGGSAETPGVIPAGVELGDAETLSEKYPHAAEEIRSFPSVILRNSSSSNLSRVSHPISRA
jgi:hypothetical protein